MSKRANPALIGFFVLSAIAILVAVLLYFGSGSYQGDRYRLQAYFKGSVAGLQVGAPVVLKGVTIGRVVSIHVGLYPEEQDFVVPVVIEVEEERILWPPAYQDEDQEAILNDLVQQGLRARLVMQSLLTGQLMVEIGFFPDSEVLYRGRNGLYPEIPTFPSALETLRLALEKFPMERVAAASVSLLEGLDQLVNSRRISSVLEEIELAAVEIRTMAQTYERLAEPVGDGVSQAAADASRLFVAAQDTLDEQSINLDTVLSEVRQLVQALDNRLLPAIDSVRQAGNSAQETFSSATSSFESINEMVGTESPLRHEVLTLMRNLSDTARSLKSMADYLERHPDALLRGKR